MNFNNVLQPALFIVVLLAAAIPVSRYLSRVMDGSSRVVKLGGPIERLLYRLAGVRKAPVQLGSIAGRVPPFDVFITVEDGDEIEQVFF